MDETLTEIEQKVIGILTQHEQSPDAYGGPIHEIERAMGWTNMQTNEFLMDSSSKTRASRIDHAWWRPLSAGVDLEERRTLTIPGGRKRLRGPDISGL
jgi:hypothetical protein